ncbi:MAG: phosphoserine phosphatase SerB [Actinomycetota bacterium]
MSPRQTVLIRVNGPDRPGINAGLMHVLSTCDAAVQDVEQIVIRGQIALGVVVEVPEGNDLLRNVLLWGWEEGIEVDFDVVPTTPTPTTPGMVVTVLGPHVTPAEFGAVTRAIADVGANIDRIVRLSRYPVMSYELLIRTAEEQKLRRALLTAAADLPEIDIAIQREGLGRRAKRLVVLDVDSTLIQDEVIELLAAEAGVLEQVRAMTDAAMAGEVDFEASLRDRVRLLAGLDVAAVDRAWANLRYTPGAATFLRTLRRLGYVVAVVSGGFTVFTDRLQADLGLDSAHANELEVVDGRFTGEVIGEIVDRDAKARLLREIAAHQGVPIEQTVAVGDGANDLAMLEAAGLGVAFNAKPVVSAVADTSITVPYLDAVLFMLGIRREDIEAADA